MKKITIFLTVSIGAFLLINGITLAQDKPISGGPDGSIDCVNRNQTNPENHATANTVFIQGIVWRDGIGGPDGQQQIPPEPLMYAIPVFAQCNCGPNPADNAEVFTNTNGQYQIPVTAPPNQTLQCVIDFNPPMPPYTFTAQNEGNDATDSDVGDNGVLQFPLDTSNGISNIDAGLIGPDQPPTAITIQATSTQSSTPHTILATIFILLTLTLLTHPSPTKNKHKTTKIL